MKSILAAPAFLLALIFSANASAVLFTVDDTKSSVSLVHHYSPIGDWWESGFTLPQVQTVGNLGSVIFDLNVGESHTFDFFRVDIDELCYCGGDYSGTVNATLAFSQPGGSSSDAGEGSLSYAFLWIAGVWTEGSLIWNNQNPLVTYGDFTYSVAFSNLDSNVVAELFGNGGSEVVQATVQLVAVPEPASLGLLGFSLLGLAFLRHRQQARAKA